MPDFIKICGVEIPVDYADFSTPRWPAVLDFHAAWLKKVDWSRHGDPWPFQPYMLEYAKELEKRGYWEETGGKRYQTADEIIQRCFRHFGLGFLEHYAKLETVPRNG